MRLQRLTHYLLQHRWIAMVLAFLITFVPIIGMIGILIAALVTLRRGMVEGAWFTLMATLPYVISFYVSGSQDPSISLLAWAAVGVAVLSNVLTWLLASFLHKHTGFSTLLQAAALLGVLIISILHLAYPSVADWWGVQLQSYYAQALKVTSALRASSVVNTNEVQAEATKAISMTKEYASGLMMAAILFNAIFQLIIARWWQVLVFAPAQLRDELHGIRMSHLAGILFIVSLVLSYWGNSVVLDVMPIVYLLFGGAGLSLIHYLFGMIHSSTNWFWLAIVYLTLIFSLPVSLMVIAILALLDAFLDIRQRLTKSGYFR
jgi:hypothetical protein